MIKIKVELLKFLKNMKSDLEKEGLIPTIDEAIRVMEEDIDSEDVDCHASPEDGCSCPKCIKGREQID